jgi:2-amino-4-hydroxy-6-hydroxymethyldihydropteridine diphosphokinase
MAGAHTAYLLLGSNQGNSMHMLAEAIRLIEVNAGEVVAKSSVYRTEPWGNKEQQDFLNQALCIQTPLAAHDLLKQLLNIETQMGRIRHQKWEPRMIDIDMLFFDEDIIQTIDLVIPHPLMHERKFTLLPMSEIAATMLHPVLKKNILTLLKETADTSVVEKM